MTWFGYVGVLLIWCGLELTMPRKWSYVARLSSCAAAGFVWGEVLHAIGQQ